MSSSKPKFFKLGEKAVSSELNIRFRNSDAIDIDNISVEQGAVFSLDALRMASDEFLEKASNESKLPPSEYLSAVLSQLMSNGTSRSKVSAAWFAKVDTKNVKKSEFAGTDEDGTIDVSRLISTIEISAKSQYNQIKSTKNSANGGKLLIRVFPDQYTVILIQSAAAKRVASKIANKLGISEPRLVILCNQAFPDLKTVSIKDAQAFLKIMANYMKRQRSGKSLKDVLGDDIDRKSIFLSLATRLYVSHPELGGLNNTDMEKVWENPSIPNVADVDLESYLSYRGKPEKLSYLLTLFDKKLDVEMPKIAVKAK